MGEALPFRRLDLVDRDLEVVLRGPSVESLAPEPAARLEEAVLAELRPLVRERLRNPQAPGSGLIGLDYRITLHDFDRAAPGQTLVLLERVAIRSTFAGIVARGGLDVLETECARLLAAGYADSGIALRLGLAPIDVASTVRSVLRKTSFSDRDALRRGVYAHARLPRHHDGKNVHGTRERILKLA